MGSIDTELKDPADYIRMKHSRDFDQFTKESHPDGSCIATIINLISIMI